MPFYGIVALQLGIIEEKEGKFRRYITRGDNLGLDDGFA